MVTSFEILFYVVAGMNPDKLLECKVFKTYEDASDYFSILESQEGFPFISMRKQGVKEDVRHFQDIKSVRRQE